MGHPRGEPAELRGAGGRRGVAVDLEVIDERGLERDQPPPALGGVVAGILEGARPRVGEQLLEPAVLERQQEQPIGDAGGERHVVGHDDHRDPERAHLLADQPRQHPHAVGIEADRRLVEEQQPAPAREHARHRDPLGLAAGQPGHRRAGRGERRIEADPGEPGRRVVAGGGRALGVAQRELEVAAHVEVVEQRAALGHEAELIAVERQLGGDHVEPAGLELGALEQHARERGLAGARAAEQDHHLARGDREIHLIDQHAPVGQRDAQAADGEGGGGHHARLRR